MNTDSLARTLAMAGLGGVGDLQNTIQSLESGFNYKGSVSTIEDLPSSAQKGDEYTVGNLGPYVYDGTNWVNVTIKGQRGETGEQGPQGEPGEKGETGPKGEDGAKGQDGISPTVTSSKEGKITTVIITDAEGPHTLTIKDGEDGSGTGDMLKSIYDANNNGIVDNAEKVNNHTVETDVPADAVFTDTTYSNGSGILIDDNVISADLDVLASKEDLENKQDNLTDEQIAATESGITAENYEQINDDVDEIKRQLEEDIPTKEDLESKQNKLTEGLGILIEDSTNTIMVDSSYVATKTDLEDKQDTLQSGVNIKTINNQSLLGSGNITIEGSEYEQGKGIIIDDNVIINALALDLPEDAKVLGQVEEMPEGAETGTVVQYIGPTTENYTHNYFYEYTEEEGWIPVDVQKSDNIEAYLKNASISGNTLTITKQDDTTLSFTPAGEGGITDVTVNGSSVVSEGVAIIENMATTDDIPTKTSDLTNDSGFITNSYHDNTKQDKLTAGTGIIIDENNVVTYDEVEVSSVEYVDANINDTMNFIIQERNTERTARIAGDDLLQDQLDDVKEDISGLEDDKQDKITSSNKLSYSLILDTPDIPSKTSDLTNDSGFITNSYHDSSKQDTLTAGQGISSSDLVNNTISQTYATSSSIGGIKIRFDSATSELFIRTDGQDA